MKRKIQFTFLLLVFGLMTSDAQRVYGTITDNDGPLPGATVSVKGTTLGTTTDLNGNYSLELDPGTYTLRVGYVGYNEASKTVEVGSGEDVQVDFGVNL